jgi:PAS domain S-box-containing protein
MKAKPFKYPNLMLVNETKVASIPGMLNIKSTSCIYEYPAKPIVESIINGFFKVDRKWTVIYWNKASEELLGVKAGDIVGKNLWEEFAAIIPINFYNVYQKAFLKDIPVHFEEYWPEKDSWFDVVTYYTNDTLSVSFKSCNQHSVASSVEQKFKILNELYKFVTEVTNDCLWEWDLQNKQIFWIDGGHKRVFGYPIVNALVPQSFWENCIHPADKARVLAGLDKVIEDGIECVWQEEYRFKKEDGAYCYVHDQGYLIYKDRLPIRMIGATQDITARKLLEIKLEKERLQNQKEITEAILIAQENERTEIGRELHENINQLLSMSKMYLERAQTQGANEKLFIKNAAVLLHNSIDEIRKLSNKLIVPEKKFFSLSDNIRHLITDLEAVHPFKIRFTEKDITAKIMDDKTALNIYRIVQEQTNNIVKHSGATQVSIRLSQHAGMITLLIKDNGKGFNTAEKMNGVGIRNIISRAELCDGRAEFESAPGKGFQLKVVLPATSQIPVPDKDV